MPVEISLDIPVMLFVIAIQAVGLRFLLPASQRTRLVQALAALSMATVIAGVLLLNETFAAMLPYGLASWARGLTMMWAFISVWMVVALFIRQKLLLRPGSEHSPQRRAVLQAASAALFAAPTVAAGYGVYVQRFDFRLREQDIHIADLPEELNGLSLVQLTDIHLSPFLSERELARVVDMANETKARIALVTGDLITRAGDPLDACLRQLARLKSDAGTFGCMGNHERYAKAERYVAEQGQRMGMTFLRHQSHKLTFGDAQLNLVGVDYQSIRKEYLRGAESHLDPSAFNLLLSHSPDVFPVAASKGFDLTVSGHTHGGQVRIEILEQELNIARFLTPFVDGLYQRTSSEGKRAFAFVSRGIGTIGMPARLGVPPEVALLRLWKSPHNI